MVWLRTKWNLFSRFIFFQYWRQFRLLRSISLCVYWLLPLFLNNYFLICFHILFCQHFINKILAYSWFQILELVLLNLTIVRPPTFNSRQVVIKNYISVRNKLIHELTFILLKFRWLLTRSLWCQVFSLSLNSNTYFVLAVNFIRASGVHYFNLLYFRLRLLLWHFKMSLVYWIVVQSRQVLIKVLHTLINRILEMAPYNSLVVLLVKQFDKSVIRHVFSCLDEPFSLKLNVRVLSHKLFVECLLNLHRGAITIWI